MFLFICFFFLKQDDTDYQFCSFVVPEALVL